VVAAAYLALIGDVVGSRLVDDRPHLQSALTSAMESINPRYAKAIAAGFTLTVGDEFQGLLAEPAPLVELLAQLRADVHPVELRFGLGVGPLSTPLQPVALGMDGPCFHRARQAVERAEANGTPVEVEPASAASTIYSLLSAALRRRWTVRQRQVHDLAASGLAGKQIAAQLGITASAVSQHLQAADRDSLAQAEAAWLASVADLLASEKGPA
jgi:DNA-binding NarL/FixJ family response regulator